MTICAVKISGIVPGNEHTCGLPPSHIQNHKCACLFEWQRTAIPLGGAQSILVAMVMLMDSSFDKGTALIAVDQEATKIGLTAWNYISTESATLIIQSLGQRLNYEFDVPN